MARYPPCPAKHPQRAQRAQQPIPSHTLLGTGAGVFSQMLDPDVSLGLEGAVAPGQLVTLVGALIQHMGVQPVTPAKRWVGWGNRKICIWACQRVALVAALKEHMSTQPVTPTK